MKKIRYITAGESHGPALTAVIDGLPAGFRADMEKIRLQSSRRQKGYGRGGRMKIESDTVEILSGVRGGLTLGSPVTLQIRNSDFENWRDIMDPWSADLSKAVSLPRPGHADYAGMLKYETGDLRNILERASARETAIRTAVGAFCRQFLEDVEIGIYSRVIRIGGVHISDTSLPDAEALRTMKTTDLNVMDSDDSDRMKEEIQAAMKQGDSLGGIFQIFVTGLPAGLGSHVQWDERISSVMAAHIMGINALKGVEFGRGFQAAAMPGSEFHDPFRITEDGDIMRSSNNAGGQEGGMSNGEVFYFQAVMKPIPTLARPLPSVDLATHQPRSAFKERTDSCAVPAASVVAENVTAIPILDLMLAKYGGDSWTEFRRHYFSGREK